jgi:uncharacterized protein (DUF3084 family)
VSIETDLIEKRDRIIAKLMDVVEERDATIKRLEARLEGIIAEQPTIERLESAYKNCCEQRTGYSAGLERADATIERLTAERDEFRNSRDSAALDTKETT